MSLSSKKQCRSVLFRLTVLPCGEISGKNTQFTSMKLNSSLAITILSAIMLASCKQLPESTSQILVALLLDEAGCIRAPLKIAEVGQVAALTQRETEAMNVAFQTQTFAGLNTVEARQSQAVSFRELLNFVQAPEFEQNLQWTGPIEGVAQGVTFPTGQPPNWTPEPPPLPAADDDLLILIGICILIGHCDF